MKYKFIYVLLLALIILPISAGQLKKGQAENILKQYAIPYALMHSYQYIEESEKIILIKLESIAQTKEITLSDEAKDSIVLELIKTNIYENKPLSEIPESQLYELLDQIVTYNKNKIISGVTIRNYKVEQVTKNIEIDIKAVALKNNVSLDDETYRLIFAEMSKLTESSAASGLIFKEIVDRNNRYLKLLFTSVNQKLGIRSGDSGYFHNGLLTETMYHTQEIKTNNIVNKETLYEVSLGINLNKPRVLVNISTIPDGAEVFVNDVKIGKTIIPWKFDCDKEYNLSFNLVGFRKQSRPYRFKVSDDQQPILEILHKADKN